MRLMSTIYYLVRRYQRIRRVKTEDRNVRLYSYILYGRNMVNGLSYVYTILYIIIYSGTRNSYSKNNIRI